MVSVNIKRLEKDEPLENCFQVRHLVFVIEQNCPHDIDVDGHDDEAIHYLAMVNDKAVATARVRLINDYAKIERVAVLKECRGKNIGLQLMQFILFDLQKNDKIIKAKLSAQTYALPFYEKFGFKAYGDEYGDVGIPHFDMSLDF